MEQPIDFSVKSPCSGSSGISTSSQSSRKRASQLPDSQKDDSYWERRKKNNEAAKRSRDCRRQKEEETRKKAMYLEAENYALRYKLQTLQDELSKYSDSKSEKLSSKYY